MIQIQNSAECCGCSACVSICPVRCISLEPTEEGFLQAQVNADLCVQCGACDRVCPMLNPPAVREDPQAFAMVNLDDTVRMDSSSGGIFSLLAEAILAAGGAVCGAVFDDQFAVVHALTNNADDIPLMRGAKYVQSDKNTTFMRIGKLLDANHPVLFTGTPCEVAGLHRYLGGDHPCLMTADFICHGIPSPLVWQKMLAQLGDVETVNFRNKCESWRKYLLTFETADEEINVPVMESGYMRGFLRDLITRPSCVNCPARGNQRLSDLTLADFWGVEKIEGAPDDDRGTSLVLAHTQKGKAAIAGLSDLVTSMEVSVEDALRYNPCYSKNAEVRADRAEFFAALKGDDVLQLLEAFAPPEKDDLVARMKSKIKTLLKKR